MFVVLVNLNKIDGSTYIHVTCFRQLTSMVHQTRRQLELKYSQEQIKSIFSAYGPVQHVAVRPDKGRAAVLHGFCVFTSPRSECLVADKKVQPSYIDRRNE
jgi:hypothetical protein